MFSASPSPSASRSPQKTAYVRSVSAEGRVDCEMEFYPVALNHDVSGVEDDGSVKVITPIKAAIVPLYGGFAAVDNKLYCMGGNPAFDSKSYRKVRSLHCFDTSSRIPTKSSWKRRASMHNGRFLPPTVVVGSKIFVFSGLEDDWKARQWAEVYDTKSGRWTFLSPPPQLPTAFGLFAVALTGPSRGKFLVGSCADAFFYTYYVEDGHWDRWDNKMDGAIPCDVIPVAVNTTLFWFNFGMLHAYDLITKCSYSGCIKDLGKAIPLDCLVPPNNIFCPAVHHVAGNVFSLLCVEYFSVQHQSALLHCVQFSISDLVVQVGKDVCLDATVRSSKAYAIPMPDQILDAVVMNDGGS